MKTRWIATLSALPLLVCACHSQSERTAAGPPTVAVDTGKDNRAATTRKTTSTEANATLLVKTKMLGGDLLYFDDGDTKDSQSPFIGVIVPAQLGRRFYVGHYDDAGEYWTPSLAQVIALGHRLLDTVNEHDVRVARQMNEYRFQIVGIVAAGKKLIFASGFCRAPEGWQTRAVIVDDGGSCYFTFKYDPATSEISSFSVNGNG